MFHLFRDTFGMFNSLPFVFNMIILSQLIMLRSGKLVFSSQEFIFLFLPVTIIVYLILSLLRKTWVINLSLLIVSFLFYYWGSGYYLLILIIVVMINYIAGLFIDYFKDNNRGKTIVLATGIVFQLSTLFYFKYYNFFMEQVNLGLSWFSIGGYQWEKVILPIGISFYIFQSITYLVDLYREDEPVEKNPLKIAMYVSLFPQLIAGPIVRYKAIAHEIGQRTHDLNKVSAGITRFIHGLAKKVIIADTLAIIADSMFSATGDISTPDAWLGVLAYTLQIYFDFSGYSDMAIGLGLIFGFHFPENFNRPYSSFSITDFWRRWHMTLSQFFRDYVYIPMGGSRHGISRTYIHLVAIFLLTGLWHGANWTFVIWGAYHGTLLIIERILTLRDTESSNYPILRRGVTIFLVMIGWVLFRSDDMSQAYKIYSAMFSFNSLEISHFISHAIDTRVTLCFLFGSLIFFMPREYVTGKKLGDYFLVESLEKRQLKYTIFMTIYAFLAFSVSILVLSNQTYSPFLYFQF